MIQFMRQQPMAARVARQKVNLPARDFAADDRIGRIAERRLDLLLLRVGEPFDLVKSAPADDADGWLFRDSYWAGAFRARSMICKREACANLAAMNVPPASSRSLLLRLCWLVSCSSTPPSRSFNQRESAVTSAFCATAAGSARASARNGAKRASPPRSATSFRARHADGPLATAEIFYNDRAGIEAMAAASEFRRVWPILPGPVASLVLVGLKDQSGRFLPGLIVGDRWFVDRRRRTALLDRVAKPERSSARSRPLGRWSRCDRWPPGLRAQTRLCHRAAPHARWWKDFAKAPKRWRLSFRPGARIVCAGKISTTPATSA